MKKNLFFLLLSFIMFGSSSAWALSKEGDVYQIRTGQDLVDFSAAVNGGDRYANAVLVNDIDMSGLGWTPIGNSSNAFRGVFDGQGFRIKNLDSSANFGQYDEQGLFGRVRDGATIKNVILDASCVIAGKDKVGAIIGYIFDSNAVNVIENCGNEAYVHASGANAAGIVGCVNNEAATVEIRNCYNSGKIEGNKESAAICGWMGRNASKIINTFNTGEVIGYDNDGVHFYRRDGAANQNCYDVAGTQVTRLTLSDAWVASGEFAYKLNENADAGVFRQNLTVGTPDALPVLDASHGLVYANGEQNCDGTAKEGATITYSNTEGANRDDHVFVDGICTSCMKELQVIDGFYQIGCADAFLRFAEIVNTGINGAAKGVLTKDIDMTGKVYTPIGQDGKDFTGHFNGQGHRIKNLNLNNYGAYANQALFGQAGGEGCIIENVIIDASCKIEGKDCTAGLIGRVWIDGITIRNCGNEANIKGSGVNCAGILGCSQGKKVFIENCYNTGNIEGEKENAGICAWMGSNSSTISNCYSTGTVSGGDGNEGLWRKGEVVGVNMYQINGQQGTAFTTEQLESGELAFLLNGKVSGGTPWHQVIGTDAHPVPVAVEGGVVYTQGSLNCDGTAKDDVTYVNTETAPSQDDHQFEDGFCSVCGHYDPAYMTETDGYYEVETGNQLRWIAAASVDNASMKVKLMNDIDMQGISYDGIGADQSGKRFNGEIDGQFNIIKNLTMSADRQGVGLVNWATAGAAIKNLTMDATCSFQGKSATGAFIGGVREGSGTLTFNNCGNEAAVTTTDQNAGGLLGCNFVGEVKVIVTNAYNVGTITSGWEAGGLSGWFGNNAEMHNVYNAGTVTGDRSESFGRGNDIQLNGSSYDIATNWPGMYVITNDSPVQVVDGTLTDALADNVWHQALGEGSHPVLHKNYDLDETFAHHKFYAHADANISMTRTTAANTWNTICLPFALDADEIATIFGSDAQVAEFDSYDAAADNYSFKSVTEMEAGKAYLVKPSTALSAPVTLTGKALVTEAVANDFFKGDFNPQAVAVGDKIVAANNIAMNVNKADRIKGFRAFFPSQGGEAKDGTFTVDGESTGIIAIENGKLNAIDFNGAVYDLQGRKVSTPKHGVYVVNGKKVVIK